MRSQLDRDKILTGVHTAEDGTPVDFDGRYTVDGYRGVAFYLMGWAQEWTEESWALDCTGPAFHEDTTDPDDHGEGCYLYSEPEQVDDRSRVVAVMVGDDREHIVDVGDLTEIGPAADGTPDYCGGCGSTTCQADGRNS